MGFRQLSKAGNVDLLNGPIFSSLLKFMVPIMLSSVLQQLYNAVDTAIVGNFLGEHSLAAIGACSSVFEMLVGLSVSLASGFGLVVASYYGMGDEQNLRKAVAGAITIGIGTSLLLTLLCNFFLRPLLQAIHTPESIFEESYIYIHIICSWMAVTFAYNLFSVFLRSIGNSIMPLIFLAVSTLLNLFLDIVLISVFSMGIAGSAVATIISQGVSVVLCVVYILHKAPFLVPHRRDFRISRQVYQRLIGQVYSMAVSGSVVSCGSVILQAGVNGLGEGIIASNIAARKVFAVCNLPFGSMGLAMATFVSQNKGAGNLPRIRLGLKTGILYNLVADVGMSIFLWTTGKLWIHLISGSEDANIIYAGAQLLYVVGPFFIAMGLLDLAKYTLQALGSKIFPLVSSVIELAGKCLFTAFLIPRFGYTAVIFCEPLIWCAMAVQLWICLCRHPDFREKKGREPSKLDGRRIL